MIYIRVLLSERLSSKTGKKRNIIPRNSVDIADESAEHIIRCFVICFVVLVVA